MMFKIQITEPRSPHWQPFMYRHAESLGEAVDQVIRQYQRHHMKIQILAAEPADTAVEREYRERNI